MSDNSKKGLFLVREEILPEAIKKTIKVKEMLKHGDVRTINEAVERMDLSRSAYYKYKDYIYLPEDGSFIFTHPKLADCDKTEDTEAYCSKYGIVWHSYLTKDYRNFKFNIIEC